MPPIKRPKVICKVMKNLEFIKECIFLAFVLLGAFGLLAASIALTFGSVLAPVLWFGSFLVLLAVLLLAGLDF